MRFSCIKKRVLQFATTAILSSLFASPVKGSSELFSFVGDKNYKSPFNVEITDAKNQADNLSENWWKETSFYHIWVKSFKDSNGDGCGDFKGIEQELDYIKDSVCCNGIWLSPIFDCYGKSKDVSANMHGYDTINHYELNECFGSEEDLISLINACHKKGIGIIFDFVPNHTSPWHSWFQYSARMQNGKFDWYMWNDDDLNWTTNMASSGWYKTLNNKFYYGAFSGGMPDLNFRNYEVREEMKNILRYWLNKGFDGARIDAVRYLIENKKSTMDTPESHQWFQELRREVVDAYQTPKFIVCEAWAENDRKTIEAYFGTEKNPEFNMVFDFDQGHPCYISSQFHFDKTENTLRANPTRSTAYGTFLGNHDLYEARLGTRMKNDSRQMKQVTALSLLRPTVPFIYYGNELGQKNVNYGDDMSLRGPLNWNLANKEKEDKLSVLNLNSKILTELRTKYKDCFAYGNVKKLTTKAIPKYLAYEINGEKNRILCVYNFSTDAVASVQFDGISNVKFASCIIGDADSPELEFAKDSVVVKNMAPFAYRVYVLDQKVENIFDDETYIENEKYVSNNDTTPEFCPASRMFLRGSMNNWAGTEMKKKNIEGDSVWTCEIYLNPGYYEYKFCVNNEDAWGANWGNPDGSNVKVKSEGSKYLIEFVENKGTNQIKKIE